MFLTTAINIKFSLLALCLSTSYCSNLHVTKKFNGLNCYCTVYCGVRISDIFLGIYLLLVPLGYPPGYHYIS